MTMSKIERYSFGEMIIDGERYTSDVIIFPDGRVKSGWWRKSGHEVCADDLSEIIEAKPEVLVLGTGYSGLVKVKEDAAEALKRAGIELIAKPTREASKLYNELAGKRRVCGAFHLTC